MRTLQDQTIGRQLRFQSAATSLLSTGASGTIDFIFGYGTAVLQPSKIVARKNIKGQQNTLTASGRFAEDSTGFSLEYCSIEADFDLAADVNSTPTYLGRPWGKYARTEFMKSSISNVIRPEGLLSGMGNLL